MFLGFDHLSRGIFVRQRLLSMQLHKNCVVSFGKVSWIAQLRILEKQKNEHKKQQQQESDGQKEGNEQKKQAKTNAIAI